MADVADDLHQVPTVRSNPIWSFAWDPARPGKFQDVTIRSRGMGMDYGMEVPVYEEIEFDDVKVVREDGSAIELELDAAHMVGAWWTRRGHVPEATTGLWRLEANIDVSLLVAFAYELDGTTARPLSAAECAELGDALMPPEALVPRGFEFIAGKDAPSAWICVGNCRYVLLVELVLCKENDDFVPGNLVGFARIHPHALLWSTENLKSTEVSIVMSRPAAAMTCGDPTMKDQHHPLLVADTNYKRDWVTELTNMPIPYTDVLYDYYETDPLQAFGRRAPKPASSEHPLRGDHPLQRRGELTLTDPRFREHRWSKNLVKRTTPITRDDGTMMKEPRQGQFDSVHIAPRMRLEFESGGQTVVLDDIVMINQCLHDCTHMHVRWGTFLQDKIMRGWGNSGPYTVAGAPGVPLNQVVFASFPNRHTLHYRAVAEDVAAGAVQVFCHHGLAYAVDAWPTARAAGAIQVLHQTIRGYADTQDEPYSPEMPSGWAAFYWRVRWRGRADRLVARSVFDIEECCRRSACA